jgi:uncharacterized protein YutE (UPF0331/DUF86 family)
MNGDAVLTKAQIVRENLTQLAAIPQSTLAEFESDFRNVQSALHLLQTSIQSLIDIGSWYCAALGLRTPASSHEVFERLESDGRLPAGTAARAAPIVGFRNRVVHLYDRIDASVVHRILTEDRPDLAKLLDELLAIEVP